MFDNTESGLMTDEGFRAEDFNKAYEAAPATEAADGTGKWDLRGRLRSRVLWAAVVGCVMTVCSAFGIWEKIGISSETFRDVAAAIGAVLAAFGVFNDPTNREGF